MGVIVTDVKSIYLPQYPDQENMLKPFLSGFDITYAEKKSLNNTIIVRDIRQLETAIRSAGVNKLFLLSHQLYKMYFYTSKLIMRIVF